MFEYFNIFTLSSHLLGYTLLSDIRIRHSEQMFGFELLKSFLFFLNSGTYENILKFLMLSLYSQIVYTLFKQLFGLHSPSTYYIFFKFNFHGILFFHAYALHICFSVHSPHSCFVYTLQADVMLQNFFFLY